MTNPKTNIHAFYVCPIDIFQKYLLGENMEEDTRILCISVKDLKNALTNFNYDAKDEIITGFYIYDIQQKKRIFDYSWYISFSKTNGDTYEEHINHLKKKITQFISQL